MDNPQGLSIELSSHPGGVEGPPCARKHARFAVILPCCFTRAKHAVSGTQPCGVLRLRMARSIRGPYSAQDEALGVVPLSGRRSSRMCMLLWRPLCAMFSLVRTLVLTAGL